MNEQVVELQIRDRKFIFKIPYSDYLPFKEAEKKVIELIEEINPPEAKLDYGFVYSALKLAIENNKLQENTISEAKSKASSEAEKIILSAKEQISNEKMKAMTELKNEIADISIQMAEKIIKSELKDGKSQKKLIEETLKNQIN